VGLPHREPRRSFSYKEAFRRVIRPLVRFLTAMRVRPDALTATGWAFSLGAAVLFALGYTKTAGAVMLFAGLFDALDGAVALECEVGLLERAGRVVILSLFSLAGLLFAGLALVAAGALVTTVQRFLYVRRLTRS